MHNHAIITAIVLALAGCGTDAGSGNSAPLGAAGTGGTSVGGAGQVSSTPGSTPAPTAPSGPVAAMPAAPASTPAPAANGGSAAPTPAQPAPSAPAGQPASAPAVDGASDWRPLVEGAWELPAGQEGYRCVRLTVTEDMYIKEFQPIAPPGTHHTLLSVNEKPTAADGVAPCTAGDNGHTTLLGSGVGENYSAGPLPAGVAYKLVKGSQLNLNLHLFNVKDAPITGKSGTRVRTTTADRVNKFAETILAGPVSLAIPSGRSTSKGQCTIKSDTTVFAVAPHMHQLGVHLKAVANRASGEPVVLYEGPYDFEEQRQFTANQLGLKAGDTVSVECTFQNDTGSNVKFGESSLDEMCFIGLYRYPIAGEGLLCVR